MFTNADDVLKFVRDEGVQFIDVRFCDLPGVMQHFNVPAASFDADAFADGLMFDGSSIRGFQAIHESDMKLIADPKTAFVDPFRTEKTLVMNFSIVDPFTGEPYSRDPRNVAAKAEAHLRSTGIADTVFFGPEAEFYIFDDVRFETKQNAGYYYIDSLEGAWNTGREEEGGNRGYKPRYKGGYFPVPPVDHMADLRDSMVQALIGVGLQVERAHHEVGTAGQQEINYKFANLTLAADQVMLFKYIIKNVAWQAGKTVTFMPKPLFGDNGSGMHCHQSLWANGEPLFYDERGYGGLSDIARWYIGGLLHHASSLLAFTNPTVNSYHRLVPGFEAPVNLVYSARNRSACDRHLPEGQADRVPGARPVQQPLPGVRGDAAGRAGRDQEQDRAAGPGGQGPLRAAPGGARLHPAGSGLAAGRARRPGGRPRLPHRGRRVHLRPDRDLDRLEAHQRGRPDPATPAPPRVRALLRPLNHPGRRGRNSPLTCSDAEAGLLWGPASALF
jgi:glutamine synthetase